MKRQPTSSRAHGVAAVLTAILLAHCSASSSGSGTEAGEPPTTDAGPAGREGGAPIDPPGDTDAGPDTRDSGAGAVDAGPTGKADAAPRAGCGAWHVGTMSGYNNSDLADDPNAGSVMEFTGLTDPFYDSVPIAAVDMSDWASDRYHWVDIDYQGTIGRVAVWDACLDKDCPDGTSCCSDNKKKYASPGYLLDVETRTAKRLWGIARAEDTVDDAIEYRICEEFDPDPIAARYGATRQ